jgi:uncharacterized repeat protein (TIGR03803 family)
LFCVATTIAASSQNFKTLVDFDSANGAGPDSSLVQGLDGNLYGTTTFGGAVGPGIIFKMTRAGALTTLYSFCPQAGCFDGASPVAGLVQATDHTFYGVTSAGGSNSDGTVFRITKEGTLTTLHSFDYFDGIRPLGALVQGASGDLYGTTVEGGTGSACGGYQNCGTTFKITPEGVLTPLAVFCSQTSCPIGADPYAGLVQATDWWFYGTTYSGGINQSCNGPGCGTVFKMTPAGSLTVLHSFNFTDGANPLGGLVQASDGNFYGTTQYGGIYGAGTVFRITPLGALTTLYSFCAQTGCTDGSYPFSGLIQATDGNLYGTTYQGGSLICGDSHGCGTVFRITLGGTLTTLHSFAAYPTDGSYPYGALFQATNGVVYGTTFAGGAYNDCAILTGQVGCGTVFSLSTGLSPFVAFVRNSGKVGQTTEILGQGLKGTTAVSFNGTPASFTIGTETFLTATVPAGATTGFVTVTTSGGTLKSNVPFRVRP